MKKGFTLIEMLVVVLIVGILAAVAVPEYQRAVAKSRYVQLMTMGDAISKGAALFKMANGKYPTTLDVLDLSFTGTLSDDNTSISVKEYTCHLFMESSDGSVDSILCSRGAQTNPQYIGYRIMLGGTLDGRRFCLAKEGNESVENFCLTMGGFDPFDNSSGLIHYELP